MQSLRKEKKQKRSVGREKREIRLGYVRVHRVKRKSEEKGFTVEMYVTHNVLLEYSYFFFAVTIPTFFPLFLGCLTLNLGLFAFILDVGAITGGTSVCCASLFPFCCCSI